MEGLTTTPKDAAPDRLSRRIGGTLADVAEAAREVEAFCAARGADEGAALRIGLALDELAANALVHGAASKISPDIDVEVRVDASHLHLRIAASGPPFDPRAPRIDDDSKPGPKPGPKPAGRGGDERGLGGRGLTILFALADRLAYARRNGRNVTTFSVVKHGDTLNGGARRRT